MGIKEKIENMSPKTKKEIKSWAVDIAIAVVLALLVLAFIKPTSVNGPSMEPTFEDGDYLFISRQSYGLFGGVPERGDVVIAKSHLSDVETNSTNINIIKRVIGVPGDTVALKEGYVYVNGEKLEEAYLGDQGQSYGEFADNQTYKVPENCVFLMGDNRIVSEDSRFEDVGYVPYDNIIGRVILRVFPFNKMATY
ncbi:MAG: signal peptidase I [Clostridia bacterium]|nr:signal peptidase I [Clostridia bacterium]